MKTILKKCAKWAAGIVGFALTITLVIVLFPYISKLALKLLPDLSENHIDKYVILNEQIKQSARLETETVNTQGVAYAEVPAALIKVAATKSVAFNYEASFGIDLREVDLSFQGSRVVFLLPDPVLLNSSIEPVGDPKETGSPAVMPDTNEMLAKERRKLDAQYLEGKYLEGLRAKSEQAIRDTIISWMSELDGNLTYSIQWAEE